MLTSKTPWLDPDQEAPDPVDFARQQAAMASEPISTIPALTDQAPTVDLSMAQALAMIAEALKTIKAGDATATTRLAGIEQFLMTQAVARPQENLFNPPMVSAFNPEGERDHPRPDLKCRMIWVGYELTKDLLSRQEIELLNQIEPGVYRVTKADGRVIRFTVTERQTEEGRREMLTFHFPCREPDDRQNHQSMVAYLQECLGLGTVNREALIAEVQALKAKLAAAVAATRPVAGAS